jgi:hypothetical protein
MNRFSRDPSLRRRIPVDSSVLVSVTYEEDATLDVEFKSGARYRYFAVPPSLIEALLASESKGTFFNRYIKSRFPFKRLGL